MQNYSLLEYIFNYNLIIFYELFEFIWNLNNPNFFADYEPGLFELFIWPFLFFLVLILIFWIIWVLLKNKIQIKEIWKWKYVFVYIFPWFFGWIIWSSIIFWLLHKKLDKRFFIHSIVSVFLYLMSLWIIFIVLEF